MSAPTPNAPVQVQNLFTDSDLYNIYVVLYYIMSVGLVVTLSSSEQGLSSSSVSASGTVSAGKRYVNFFTSSDFVGTINGVAREQFVSYPFTATIGRTLPAINYVITSGSIVIDTLNN